MKKYFLLLILATFITTCFAQNKPKIKWKHFLGTWYSKDSFDKEKGKTVLGFDRKSATVKPDSLTQTCWRFFEGDSLYFIKNYRDKPDDITRLKWFYVKASNTLQIRQQVDMG